MILVTGATGNVGRPLTELLASQGASSRAAGRRTKKLLGLPKSVETIAGDLRDPAIVRRALQGIDRLFLLPMFGEADGVLIEEAKRAQVSLVVMLSTVAPDDTIIGARHRETENRLRSSGLRHTILRAGAFMSNALGWAASIKNRGAVFTPIPDAELTPIAPSDVAAVAGAALSATDASGQVFELTGLQVLTTRRQVQILSKVLGRDIDCIEISITDMAARMTIEGAPAWLVEAVSEQMGRIRNGRAPLTTDQFEQFVGRAPISFEQWCVDYRQSFQATNFGKASVRC